MKLAAIDLFPQGGFRGFGPLGLENNEAFNADSVFVKFLSSTLGLMSIIAIIWFLFLLITGGYGYMTAAGDKGKLESAHKKIISGLVGLLVVVFGIFIIKLIGWLIGIPNILQIPSLFSEITK